MWLSSKVMHTVTNVFVGSHKVTDVYKVPFKLFVLPVAGLMPKRWPLYKLVGKLVFTYNTPIVLLPTDLLHDPERTA